MWKGQTWGILQEIGGSPLPYTALWTLQPLLDTKSQIHKIFELGWITYSRFLTLQLTTWQPREVKQLLKVKHGSSRTRLECSMLTATQKHWHRVCGQILQQGGWDCVNFFSPRSLNCVERHRNWAYSVLFWAYSVLFSLPVSVSHNPPLHHTNNSGEWRFLALQRHTQHLQEDTLQSSFSVQVFVWGLGNWLIF